jgi:two-component system chemotaxis response regulator CheY
VIHNLETEVQFNLVSPARGFGLSGGKDGEPAAALPSIEEGGAPAIPNPSRRVASAGQGSLRVIIVDDVASTRRFLRSVLENCDQFEVVGEAADGYAAIEKAKLSQPDLILLDLSMPMVDGAMALAGIRQVAPKATVILVSGMNPRSGDSLLKAGASAFVPKGIPPFELLDRLGSILGRKLTIGENTGLEGVLSDHRAVVCEEASATRHLITQVLDECDVAVTTETANAATMLEIVDQTQPELVIANITVNGEPDTSFVSEICRRSPRSAVIVYSEFTDWKHKALAAGATAFVPHPRTDQLAESIRLLTLSL